MNYNLAGQQIKDTYQNLVQVSASVLVSAGGVALSPLTVPNATTAVNATGTAATASYVQGSKVSGVVASATSASHALVANTAINSTNTAATSSWANNAQTASNVVATVAAGTAVDARSSTSGYAIYAQSLLSEAVLATQTGILTGTLNRSVVNAYRDILNLNGFDTVAAVMNVEDADYTGSAPIFTVKSAGSTEVLKVDKTGSLWVSGSRGVVEASVVGTDSTSGLPVTMSFKCGILVSVS